MLGILLKNRLQALLTSFFRTSKKRIAKSLPAKIGIAALIIYLLVCFYALFYFTFDQLAVPLFNFGLGWLYFALVTVMTLGICIIFTLFMAQKQLFEATDNELLLSMPIPPRSILASRMLMLLVFCGIFELIVLPPAIVAWCRVGTVSLLPLINFVIVFLTLPLFAVAISSLLGWLLELLTSRMTKKNIGSLVLSLIFLAAYFYVYTNFQNYINAIIANSSEIALTMQQKLPPLFYLGSAIDNGNLLHLFIYLLWVLLPFAAVYALLSRSFIRIATTKRGGKRIKYVAREMKVKSPLAALLGKELWRLGSSSVYMLNGALGAVLMVVAAVFLVIKREEVLLFAAAGIGDVPAEVFTIIAAMAICLMSSLNMLSASTISLEAKSIWVPQSLPLEGGYALIAKVLMHIVVVLPATLILSIAAVCVLGFEPLSGVLVVLCSSLFTVFMALFGVCLNLRFPKFDWVSEAVVVKQSLAVLIAMFGGMAIGIVPFVLYMLLLYKILSPAIFFAILCLIFLGVNIYMYVYLKGKGAKKFAYLS